MRRQKISIRTVYQTLNGSKSGLPEKYHAADAGASYFMALAIDGIPEGATITVTPYAVAGGACTATATGESESFIIENGLVKKN